MPPLPQRSSNAENPMQNNNEHDNSQDDQDEFDEGVAKMTPKERAAAIRAVVEHNPAEEKSLRSTPEPEILQEDEGAKGRLSDLSPEDLS